MSHTILLKEDMFLFVRNYSYAHLLDLLPNSYLGNQCL